MAQNGWWNLPPGPERERLKRLAAKPNPPPACIHGPAKHLKDKARREWRGHQVIPYTDRASEMLARLASLQFQPVDGIKPVLIGRELWLLAGGQRFYLISNASPTEASNTIYRCRMAIFEAETSK